MEVLGFCWVGVITSFFFVFFALHFFSVGRKLGVVFSFVSIHCFFALSRLCFFFSRGRYFLYHDLPPPRSAHTWKTFACIKGLTPPWRVKYASRPEILVAPGPPFLAIIHGMSHSTIGVAYLGLNLSERLSSSKCGTIVVFFSRTFFWGRASGGRVARTTVLEVMLRVVVRRLSSSC